MPLHTARLDDHVLMVQGIGKTRVSLPLTRTVRKRMWTVLEIIDVARSLMPTQLNVIILLDDSQHDEAHRRLPEYQYDPTSLGKSR
jgi:hypothetical protein